MLELTTPWWEIVTRAIVIYLGLMVFFRVFGKKQLGEMSPMDLVLLLIVSESVSTGLNAEEKSIAGGLLSALSLITLSYGIDFLAFKSSKMEKIFEGEPHILIAKGKIREEIRKKFKITYDEIQESLREHEVGDVKQIDYAVLETNGKITVIKGSS